MRRERQVLDVGDPVGGKPLSDVLGDTFVDPLDSTLVNFTDDPLGDGNPLGDPLEDCHSLKDDDPLENGDHLKDGDLLEDGDSLEDGDPLERPLYDSHSGYSNL